MKKDSNATIRKKVNIPGLISFLLFFLVIPLLLVPWYRLFLLRSNTITTLVIHIIGMFVIGVLMLALGVFAIALARKHKGEFKGAWMAIVGIGLGILLAGFGGFFIVDYLLRGAA